MLQASAEQAARVEAQERLNMQYFKSHLLVDMLVAQLLQHDVGPAAAAAPAAAPLPAAPVVVPVVAPAAAVLAGGAAGLKAQDSFDE